MSYCAGFVVLDPKLPAITPLWLLSNLLVTCVAEEAFFRGFLQRQLQHKLQGYSWGAVVSLSVVSLLFGVAHLSGGFSYAMIAAVAGLFYGYVYQKSGAIETSIALHFLVNAGHFILLSYPRLA
jgi:membrane protease YdiL (CAAX protease family)